MRGSLHGMGIKSCVQLFKCQIKNILDSYIINYFIKLRSNPNYNSCEFFFFTIVIDVNLELIMICINLTLTVDRY
jgi:hypothetical protein